jgi:hypothetical protein
LFSGVIFAAYEFLEFFLEYVLNISDIPDFDESDGNFNEMKPCMA